MYFKEDLTKKRFVEVVRKRREENRGRMYVNSAEMRLVRIMKTFNVIIVRYEVMQNVKILVKSY